uniref:DUF4283 domain-containing protein n=1 Tax=Brassica campestris TaxID=3711 RepID=M4CGZ6_BRACM
MSNPWASGLRASALFPSSLAAGKEQSHIPPHPPDPPDPKSQLSVLQFPPLSPKVLTVRTLAVSTKDRSTLPVPTVSTETTTSTDIEMLASDLSSQNQEIGSEIPRSVITFEPNPQTKNFTVLPPKTSSPLHTNKALTPPTIHRPSPETDPIVDTVLPSPLVEEMQNNASFPAPANNPPEPTLIEKIRRFEDKSLKRLAPVTISASGRPSVLIPDAVFQKGADLHKDFIVCCFNGRSPPYSQIQSVLNHMWGKGRKLEIHNNPAQRTVLVRIQSDYLKQKILEKGYWYVGDSMFYAIQWTSLHSSQPPTPTSIQLWAHLTGVPLDLRHQQGLSLVAGLVGEPKETDDFTKNLVSLTMSHVKVELDLTKPAPDIVEFTRESGEVVEVLVTYPWLPPTCAHCKELGHIAKNCLLLPLPHKAPPPPTTKKSPTPNPSTKTYVPKPSAKTAPPSTPSSSSSPPSATVPSPSPSTLPVNTSKPLPPTIPEKAVTISNHNFLHLTSSRPPVAYPVDSETSPPNPRLRLSLKRSRSDPTLSPPTSSLLPPLPVENRSNSSRTPIAPLLLTLPFPSDPNPYSLLVNDSSFTQGESPLLS